MWHPESGTKIVLEYEGQERILACLRDNDPSIPYPGKWDLPGGGVEPGESLLDCAYRELFEEFGLDDVPLTMLEVVPSAFTEGKLLGRAYGTLTARQVGRIVFGSEGQEYGLFTPQELAGMDFVPELRAFAIATLSIAGRISSLEQTA
jgi:8-oxo-dGTP diphosphatase